MKTKKYVELWSDKDVDEMAHLVWKGCCESDCDACEHRLEVDDSTCHVELIEELWRKWKNATEAKPMKYRWHDLRENPADLPNVADGVLVYDKGGYCVAYHDSSNWFDYNNEEWLGKVGTDDVMAWREVEEFEVSE